MTIEELLVFGKSHSHSEHAKILLAELLNKNSLELLNYLDNVFTAEERPAYLVIYPSLPRTPLGKVDYQTLDDLANNIDCEVIELEKNNIKVLHK